MPTQPTDLFLLIGQSNMAGRGRLDQVAPITHDHIHMFREGHWLKAVEPIHTDKPDIAGIGLCMSFAYELVQRFPTMNVGLIPTAVGGTPLSRWVPGADLYENAVAICKNALSQGGKLRGILWHQGEGDSGKPETANTYAPRLLNMFITLRKELDAQDVPIVAGELGHYLINYPSLPYFQTVNQHLRQLEILLPQYAVATAQDLTVNEDGLHIDAQGLREFGHRYFEKYLTVM
ncbi:MAG: sialate O-acetylesterase [Phycisphaeraceae bacterium JB051]